MADCRDARSDCSSQEAPLSTLISPKTRRDVLLLVDRKQLPATSHSSTKEKMVNIIRTGPIIIGHMPGLSF